MRCEACGCNIPLKPEGHTWRREHVRCGRHHLRVNPLDPPLRTMNDGTERSIAVVPQYIAGHLVAGTRWEHGHPGHVQG